MAESRRDFVSDIGKVAEYASCQYFTFQFGGEICNVWLPAHPMFPKSDNSVSSAVRRKTDEERWQSLHCQALYTSKLEKSNFLISVTLEWPILILTNQTNMFHARR